MPVAYCAFGGLERPASGAEADAAIVGTPDPGYRMDIAPKSLPVRSTSLGGKSFYQQARLYVPALGGGGPQPKGAVSLPWHRSSGETTTDLVSLEKRRVLVLLHGLGETRSAQLGLKAWGQLYGLENAMTDLYAQRAPRVSNFFRLQRVREFQRSLRADPFEGFVVVCPLTPNPKQYRRFGFASRKDLLDAYSEWIANVLLPDVQRRVGGGPLRVGLDGCSMGGYVATEVFLRRPRAFTSFGVVQSAIGKHRVKGFVERLKAAPIFPESLPCMHVQTSTRDPFRDANKYFATRLKSAGVPVTLTVLPGPHNQPWLRRAGTYQMLRFHDQALQQGS